MVNPGTPRQGAGNQAAGGVVNPFLRNAGGGPGNANLNVPFGNPNLNVPFRIQNLNVPQGNPNLNFPNSNTFQGIKNFDSFPFGFFDNNQGLQIGTPMHSHSSGVPVQEANPGQAGQGSTDGEGGTGEEEDAPLFVVETYVEVPYSTPNYQIKSPITHQNFLDRPHEFSFYYNVEKQIFLIVDDKIVEEN